ncbi:unnamed protein product [Lepeophtheirus salmonis]|uniref:(salmon louse) hypothetical protein n=1 Tax=Lepeophtheirus salmonis TaxID=72036 RepID=A0A7R8D3P2_LEPSM|nr:unnamed protein product [Lepeophtheirus salmonis]CAF3018149.1 unnamed protein product [Lepeophtheirus salmonis]
METIKVKKGVVKGLKAQRRDKYGNAIVYVKEITITSPHEYIRVEDIIETFKEFRGPVKECCLQEEILKGLMNWNNLVKDLQDAKFCEYRRMCNCIDVCVSNILLQYLSKQP